MSDQAVAAIQNLETTVRGLSVTVQTGLGNFIKAYETRTKELANLNKLLVDLTDGGRTFPLYVIVHGEELGADGMLEAEENAAQQSGQASKPPSTPKAEGK